jgi:hypothetical protein
VRVLKFFRRRSARLRPHCDVSTFRQQIETYLDHARAVRHELETRDISTGVPARSLVPAYQLAVSADSRPVTTALTRATDATHRDAGARALPSDRRIARRRPAADVPWLWSVTLQGGLQVRIVNISTRGVLIETPSRIGDGATFDLQLVGQDTNMSVPARMVRSLVASVDSIGVRYHIAVAFARELDLAGLQRAAPAAFEPSMLGDLLTRVLRQGDRGCSADALRVRFEQEVRQLLPVRDVQIRQSPVIAESGSESVYFTVPYGDAPRPILQAIFEKDAAPTATEFQLLKAAANLAAVVLEFGVRHPPGTHARPVA